MKSLSEILCGLSLLPYVSKNYGLTTKIVNEDVHFIDSNNTEILVDDSFLSSCFFYTEKDATSVQLKGRGRYKSSRLVQDVKGVFLVKKETRESHIQKLLQRNKMTIISCNFDYDRIVKELGLKGFEPNNRILIVEFSVVLENVCICPVTEIR
jgi:hypothetical protein